MCYNVVYTFFPIVIFDRDVDANHAYKYPWSLYQPLLRNDNFNLAWFAYHMLNGIFDSLLVVFLPINALVSLRSGEEMICVGFMCFDIVVVVAVVVALYKVNLLTVVVATSGITKYLHSYFIIILCIETL